MYMFFFYLYKVEELPFLLTRAGELDRLKDIVTKLDVFFRLSEDEDGVFELVKAWKMVSIVIPPLHWWGGGRGYTVLPASVLPSVQDIFRRIFLSNY